MGLFDRLKKTREQKALDKAAIDLEEEKNLEKGGEKLKSSASKATSAKKEKAVGASRKSSDEVQKDGGNSTGILLTPWVSEKAAHQADKGTYVFKVAISANKVEIQKAVESLWNVKVVSVRTIRGAGKMMGARSRQGKRANWKKALVTLKKGQLIDLYEGV